MLYKSNNFLSKKSKKTIFIIIIFLTLFISTLSYAESLVVNGDFDNISSWNSGWRIVEFTSGSKVEAIQESGNIYIKLHHNSESDWCAIGQEIASKFEIGNKYIFSYKYKTSDSVAIGIHFSDIYLVMHGSKISGEYGWNHNLIADNAWHTDSFEFSVTEDHPKSNEPMLGIFFDYQYAGDIYVDDISIKKVENTPIDSDNDDDEGIDNYTEIQKSSIINERNLRNAILGNTFFSQEELNNLDLNHDKTIDISDVIFFLKNKEKFVPIIGEHVGTLWKENLFNKENKVSRQIPFCLCITGETPLKGFLGSVPKSENDPNGYYSLYFPNQAIPVTFLPNDFSCDLKFEINFTSVSKNLSPDNDLKRKMTFSGSFLEPGKNILSGTYSEYISGFKDNYGDDIPINLSGKFELFFKDLIDQDNNDI